MISYAAVLRVFAKAVRADVVGRRHSTRAIRRALRMAHDLAKVVRYVRESATRNVRLDDRADEAAALVVAFAMNDSAFGAIHDTVLVVDAIVREQLAMDNWFSTLSTSAMNELTVGAIVSIDQELPVDFVHILRTLRPSLVDRRKRLSTVNGRFAANRGARR